MNEQDKINLLGKVDGLQGLRENDLKELAALSNTVELHKGETLFKEGDQAHCLFIVFTGKISVYKGSRELVQFGSGDMIGEMSLLDSGTRSATAKAKEDTILLEITENVFQDLMRNENFTLLKILKVLSKRIRESDQKLAIDHMIMTTLIHDLNNSLSCFSVASLIHKDSAKDSPNIKNAEIIMRAQKSIQEMIQSALQSYRTNQIITSKNDFDIVKTISETCNVHLANHPEFNKMKLNLILPDKTEKTPHNANDIIRVIANLAINAAQASTEGSPITLKLAFVPGYCEIHVIDQGCGIPEAITYSVFKPGFTSKPKGNGLGLYSCQNIVEKMHNGQISFTSVEGKGSEFTIRLPTA